ncbi:winged helix DNA-binding domain-containing protein [Nocardioides sp. YIM 152315]|uniref:winged helix DNA-binding domain-containing protein n=1 Tax=Nocardioides sp. YIM 152315 TaxID=3031760 RepID=UPI0023DC721B|nr:winged helix DNA-binding domain-containing protein [Nocardioides sp. YIM 152315]MDF1605217.1 winged helix DNA-binding domain-containing protein [Nocardioides sp. YIM 152315]
MRPVSDVERRSRLARRHGLASGERYADALAATRAMTVLHATEAATVHLSLWARVDRLAVDDVERALYDDRSLVKQLAMRRTLFVFPRDLLPAAWASASARVAAQQRAQLGKRVVGAGIAADADAWIARAFDDVLDLLGDGVPRTTAQVRELVPELEGRFTLGDPSKKWGGDFPIGRWVVGTLAAEGRLVRATNAGHWRRNLPTWTTTDAWLGDVPEPWSAEAGYAELVRRWLFTFGPGTEADIVWWLGSTKTAVRKALAEVGAVEVALEGDATGWVLPDDVDPVAPVEPWGALLPTLDPTVMGWRGRSFYLDASHAPYLFDTNGNAGHTAWWDGRIVGCWVQDPAGVVVPVLREDVGSEGRAALDAEAARLTDWLDGVRITNVYASPQMKGAALP